MLITCIELENIKSYRQVTVDLRRGTTAISGANGAGKTTLVEAIGYALFDYLPYNQTQFVREGEKYGRVTVHLIGSDDRPYTVERRCGSGARWTIYDDEADLRLEQSADVQDKLHELFGIDRERPLKSLFRDALGVPQGTFTSIFLEPPSRRKQVFDALLQIEDYKTAADTLLETQKHYREQGVEQQSEIQRLTYETRELDEWRSRLKEARLEDRQQKEQNAQWSQQLNQSEGRAHLLNEQRTQLQALEQRYRTNQNDHQHAQRLLDLSKQALERAALARQAVAASQTDYQRYSKAEEILKELRQQEKERNALRSQQMALQNMLAKTEEKVHSWQQRLEEVADARKQILELAPLVEQQVALEQQHDMARQREARYEALTEEGKRLRYQYDQYLQSQGDLQRKISEVEPLEAVADLLQQRTATLMRLHSQAAEKNSKLHQLEEKRNQWSEQQAQREQAAKDLRKAERNLEIIEEHRLEAEEMPVLQEQSHLISIQKSRLEGNIEGYSKSRAQSVGGQCPLLNESCLNIKQRGLSSLESYFEGLLKEEHEHLGTLDQQQESVQGRIRQIKKYADALTRLDRYIAERDSKAREAQRIENEITRLEGEIAVLTEGLAALQAVEQEKSRAEQAHKESEHANTRVRELAGLRKQLQQLQAQIQQSEADLQERRREAENLRHSKEQREQIEAALLALNDPRTNSRTQQNIMIHEDHFRQQLQIEQQTQQKIQQDERGLQKRLTSYETLDTGIAQQEVVLQLSRNGYQTFLQNQKEALLFSEREQSYQQQSSTTEQAQKALTEIEQIYLSAKSAFAEDELLALRNEIDRLRRALGQLAERMKRHQEDINRLEQQIEKAEDLLTELETAQQEKQTLEDLYEMLEQFRKLMKEAAPHILKAMLNDISAEANRIFGEVMGDRSAQLSWQEDYEIVLRRQGAHRSFAQLSGGEQMSAALSVRLALLKKLSTLNLAFFDEPTQNMDELRRMNLAEQIRRVRGFDQLIVISHDDTFEQGLDSLVRLKKEGGETHLQGDDLIMGRQEGIELYAS